MDGTTLLHGDCLDRMAEIADGSVDLIAADLPYGTTQCRWDSVIPFEPLWAHYRRALKPRGAVVLTACQPFTSMLVMSNRDWFRFDDVWEKSKPTGFLDCRRRPLRTHESVLVFSPAAFTYNPQMTPGIAHKTGRKRSNKKAEVYRGFSDLGVNVSEDYYPRSIVDFPGEQHPDHPTQKPVALMEYLIRTYSNPGDLVLDNAMGSGTTGVACLNTDRRFIGIEKDAAIFATASRRIAEARDSMPLFPVA